MYGDFWPDTNTLPGSSKRMNNLIGHGGLSLVPITLNILLSQYYPSLSAIQPGTALAALTLARMKRFLLKCQIRAVLQRVLFVSLPRSSATNHH